MMLATQRAPEETGEQRTWGRLSGGWSDRLEVIVPVVVYLLISLVGASTSSLGQRVLRQSPRRPLGTQWGEPLDIRSDEWLTATPLQLHILADGHAGSSVLSEPIDMVHAVSSGGLFESLLFFESNILRAGPALPDAVLFAAYRAFPLLLLCLALPPLLRVLGANRQLSWLAVALVVFAPVTVWFSFAPVQVMAFPVAGFYLLVISWRWRQGRRSGWLIWPVAALAGISIARMATGYVPWSIVLDLPLLVTITVLLVRQPGAGRRAGLSVLAMGGFVGSVVLVGAHLENLSALQAQMSTVYPGLRRSAGSPQPPFALFAAPGAYRLAGTAQPLIGNQSELAQGFLVCAPWAVFAWCLRRPRSREENEPAQRAAALALLVGVGVLASWIVMPWGTFGAAVPILNLVPPPRAAQALGLLAAVAACLLVSQMREISWRAACGVGGCCAVITAYSVDSLRAALPDIGAAEVWLVGLGVGALVAVISRFPARSHGVLLATAAAAALTLPVNPVVLGLGDLRASESAKVARSLAARAERENVIVTSDDRFVTALLVANGAQTLSGYQPSGPNEREWRKLDPDGRYEDFWNRGVSYVRTELTGKPGADPVVSNPGFDVITIATDACWLAHSDLRVGYLVTEAPVPVECGQPVRQLKWGTSRPTVYRLTR